jgi:hypothetical protein
MGYTAPAGLTEAWLKAGYLFDVKMQTPEGKPYPSAFFTQQIEMAIETVSTAVGICLGWWTGVIGREDVVSTSGPFYLMQVTKRPLRVVNSLKVKWGNEPSPFQVPASWIHIRDADRSEMEIIVDRTSPAFTGTLSWFGMFGPMYNGRGPAWFELDVNAGFDGTTYPLPALAKDAIGLCAASLVLEMAGDSLMGPGVTSKSISQDGLSQSRSGGGYKARIDGYAKRYQQRIDSLRSIYSVAEARVI